MRNIFTADFALGLVLAALGLGICAMHVEILWLACHYSPSGAAAPAATAVPPR